MEISGLLRLKGQLFEAAAIAGLLLSVMGRTSVRLSIDKNAKLGFIRAIRLCTFGGYAFR